MDFIFDPSLVLYLPLYKLDGASFMSKDKHGHLCTVTGALWTPHGRSFDGVDDYVNCGSNESLDITGVITIEAWIKPSDVDTEQYFIRHGVYGVSTGYLLGTSGKRLQGTFGNGTSGLLKRSAANSIPTVDIWYHAVVTLNSIKVHYYVNGVPKDHDSDFDGTFDGSNAEPLYIVYYPSYYFSGLIGEVRIYNRALTQLEIQHNYLATKWRYK